MKGPTRDSHSGRPKEGQRLINPPTDSGSTVLFADYETFRDRKTAFHYGRGGTGTHRAFEDSLLELENAAHVTLTSSGLAAIPLAIQTFAGAGGHILVTDSAYDPTRAFCDGVLSRMGVETTYYDPQIGADIAGLIRPNTQLIFCETPGSLTFEVQDIPAIVAAAGDIPVIVDNTYAAGIFFRPLDLGATISIQAITKYVAGHSDLLMGAVFGNRQSAAAVMSTARQLGHSVSARDVTLAHRGLRTLHRRMDVHQQSALEIAKWLDKHPLVHRVLHPGLPNHPGAEIWSRDATGTCGLFSFIADWSDDAHTQRFIEALELHGLGYSWGGFESLCLPAWPNRSRSAVPWTEERQLFRLHVGLEAVEDLTADLERGFDAAANG